MSALLTQLGIVLPNAPPRYLHPRSVVTYVESTAASLYEQGMQTAMTKLIDHCARLSLELEKERHHNQQTDTRLQLLVSNFEQLVDDPNGDMVFEVPREANIYAHSAVVSLWSPPFQLMLQSQMREGITKRITITTEDAASVREMVKYFYTAQANINKATALPLLRLSCLYQISSLKGECLDFLRNNIDIENCIPLFCMANLQHGTEGLSKWNELFQLCCAFIRAHHTIILSSRNSPFRGLDISLVVTILQEIERVDTVGAHNAKTIGKAILNWARETWPVCDLPELLTFINSEVARDKLQVFVKTNISTLVILTNKTKKVADLKHVIEQKEAIPTSYQWLLYNGKVLQDNATLQECGIQNDSTIQLCTRSQPVVPVTVKQESEPADEVSELWKKLHNFCLNAIVADFEQQCKCAGFLKLDVGTLVHILQQDELAVSSEYVVLEAVVSWLSVARPELRNDPLVLSRLLSLIRFPYIDTQVLMAIPRTHPVVGTCPAFKTFLHEALQFQVSKTSDGRQLGRGDPQPAPTNVRKHPLSSSSSAMEDDGPGVFRTKKRKLYNDVPAVNLNQFFSWVVSSVVPSPAQR